MDYESKVEIIFLNRKRFLNKFQVKEYEEVSKKINRIATNSRVIGVCCQSVSSEPYGSNFGWFVSWRDRSDPAAHGKLLVQSQSKLIIFFT